MPKTRKTRKQKILHDQKRLTVQDMTPSEVSSSKTETHQTEQAPITTGTYSLSTDSNKQQAAPEKVRKTEQAITVSSSEYDYLSNDLMKTALLTGAIVFAELMIRLFIVH